jgi:hypothetical protein
VFHVEHLIDAMGLLFCAIPQDLVALRCYVH